MKGFDYKAMAWADVPAVDADELIVAGAGRKPRRVERVA